MTLQSMECKLEFYFLSKNYIKHESIPVTETLDKSVRFIGSITNIFKPLYYSKKLINNFFISQECLKTKSLKNDIINRASYYPAFGLHSPINKSFETLLYTYEYLIDILNIPITMIETHVCSEDRDLVNLLKNIKIPLILKINELSRDRYIHSFGESKYKGRNIVIFLNDLESNKKREFISTFIILNIEKNDLYSEVTIKPMSIIKYLNNFNNDLECYLYPPKLQELDKNTFFKFLDIFIVCILLFKCKILPSNLNNKTRLFRKYIKQILLISRDLNFSIEELASFIVEYERKYFREDSINREVVINQLKIINNLILDV